jgi:hypothetical protein
MNKFASDIVDSQKAHRKFDELATKLDGMAYGKGAFKAALLAAAGAVPGAGGVIGTVGGAGVGIADDAAKGDGGWTSVAENVGFGGAGLIAGLAFGPLGSLFVSLAQFGYNQYKLYDMKQELEQALQESRLYLDYLNRLKKKIADYKKKNIVRNEIVFDKAKSFRKFTFYDTKGNIAMWELDMTLRYEAGEVGASGERTYTGDFTIFVQYDMSGFLNSPRDAYNKAIGGGLDMIESIQGQAKWSTANYNKNGVAEIERTITGKATAIVNAYDMVDFKFEQNDDLKATNIANIGYTLSVTASAPEIGKYWDASGDYAFMSNYSGPDNPPIKIEGQGDTRYWVHSGFTQAIPLETLQAMWEKDNLSWQKEFTFDEQAWRPWDQPNPPAELRIMAQITR